MKLSTSLCIYVLCICVCIFAGISIVLEKYAAQRESEQAYRLTELLQSHMVHDIESDMDGVMQNVDRTCREIAAMATPVNEIKAAKMLEIMIESDSVIIGGSIAYVPGHTPDGAREWMMYACQSPSGLVTRQLGNTGYRYTTKRWFTTPLSSGDATWSAPYFDSGGADCLMTTYSVPIKDAEGNVYSIITADVALEYLEDEIERLRPYTDSRSFLISSDGSMIADTGTEGDAKVPDLNAIIAACLINRDNPEGPISVKGEQYIACYSRISGPDIILATVTPYKSTLAVIMHIKLPLLIIIACGFLLLLIGIRFVIVYATRPLNRLSEAAIRIGDGDFTTPLPPAGSYGDIKRLHNAMEYMSDSIRQHVKTIAENARTMERIESELDIARSIQQGMLPRQWCKDGIEIDNTTIRIGAILQPAREVSGDMYDYVMTDGILYFIVADVSDKGVPASLVMATVHSLFRFATEQRMSPREMLDRINRHICESNPQNMFVTIILGCIDVRLGKLTLANAGHNPPMFISDTICRYLSLPPGLPAGIMDDVIYTQTEMPFNAGDALLLYTDGLTEAENSESLQYGEERTRSTVCDIVSRHPTSPNNIVTALHQSVTEFSKIPLPDDITLLCIGVEKHVVLAYDISEIPRLETFVSQTAAAFGWGSPLTQRINLILEEAVSNIINHSVPTVSNPRIDVYIRSNADGIWLDILDDSPQFDPLASSPDVDITLSAELRPVGGLGIFLIRKLVNSATYNYSDNKNHLRLYLQL